MFKVNDSHLDSVFFTGCLHLNHKNICRGTSTWEDKSRTRDFKTVEEMNQAVLDSVNSTVPSNAILFSLGDMFFGNKDEIPSFLSKINCKEIHYVTGNHCKYMLNGSTYKDMFASFSRYTEMMFKKTLITLFHFPIAIWDEHHHGSWMLHSHSHGSYEPGLPTNTDRKILDVGWDVFNRPISLREVRAIMDTKGIVNSDHHNKNTNR